MSSIDFLIHFTILTLFGLISTSIIIVTSIRLVILHTKGK